MMPVGSERSIPLEPFSICTTGCNSVSLGGRAGRPRVYISRVVYVTQYTALDGLSGLGIQGLSHLRIRGFDTAQFVLNGFHVASSAPKRVQQLLITNFVQFVTRRLAISEYEVTASALVKDCACDERVRLRRYRRNTLGNRHCTCLLERTLSEMFNKPEMHLTNQPLQVLYTVGQTCGKHFMGGSSLLGPPWSAIQRKMPR